MDGYAEALAPEFEEGGRVATPFAEWWAIARAEFPNIPDDVAEQWLHRHWGHSPYGWLPSNQYAFRLIAWQTDSLNLIASGRCDWHFDDVLAQGAHIVRTAPDLWLTEFICRNEDIPCPIIVLDNRDGHLNRLQGANAYHQQSPHGFILIEGHRRFELAAYRQSIGRMRSTISVWLMENVLAPEAP